MRFFGYIKDRLDWFFKSFHAKSDPSSRKLTAFAFMLCVFYLHLKYVDFKNAIEFLITDCLTILLLYGIVHASDITDFVKGSKEKEKDDNNNNTPESPKPEGL